MKTEIIRSGKALAVEIPEEIAAQAKLAAGDHVEWVAVGRGNVTFAKADQPHQKMPAEMTLEELLEGFNGDDRVREYDWGLPRGVEVW